ncbi:hypothetical protein A2807_01840 [Candidatus Berkelbacteria bacterium RIFCSPHIGHO2_01_FULL_50_36]|nr:MAG: hypothetical protein A2807_01840 [Candidatus Berkelbacteria bacterium RIFCSPHIGHO2_01_FULL_50_36]OGD63462.1 MAG: hypothetical protein A3F39_03190 [Candidatus Berkelbacteria bacterium RIFCSPHIGHO2_12_FULL_50_11]
MFLLFSGRSSAEVTLADQTLLGAATNLHPVKVFSINRDASSIKEAFRLAGVNFYPEDRISYFPEPSLGLGTVVTVQRALPVTVRDGNTTRVMRSWASTVGGLIKEKKIILGDDDRVAPTLITALSTDTTVTIVRVARTVLTEHESISYQVIEQEDPNMWRGERVVDQEGIDGIRELKYLLIRENGRLISKTLISDVVKSAVQSRIIRVGTKLKIGQTLYGLSTWYSGYSTEVAMDLFPAGTNIRVTNLDNGLSVIVNVDGCICGNGHALIDLSPRLYQKLGGSLGAGVMRNIRVEEVLN